MSGLASEHGPELTNLPDGFEVLAELARAELDQAVRIESAEMSRVLGEAFRRASLLSRRLQ